MAESATQRRQREHQRLLGILYQALAEPIGLLVASDNPQAARQRLYAARRLSGDASLAVLRIALSPLAQQQLLVIRADAALPTGLTLDEDAPQQSELSIEEIGL